MHYMTFFKSRLQSIVIRLTCFLIFSCLLFSSAFSIPAGFLTAQASLVPGDVHSEENLSDEKKLSSEEDPSNSENLSVDKNLSSEEDLNIEDGTPGEDLSPEDYISGEIPDSDVFDENRSDETDPLNEYKEEYEEDPGDEWPTTWPEDGITARIPRPDFDMDSLEVKVRSEIGRAHV